MTQFERPTAERLPAERIADALQAEGSIFLSVEKFEHAQRVAAMFANSTMVPKHFQGNLGNCMIALNLADRFRSDPFMIMQATYVVHGKPGLEGKLVAGLINQSGKYRRELRYRWLDPKDEEVQRHAVLHAEGFGNFGCQAYTEDKRTGDLVEGPKVTWAIVKGEGWWDKDGSKWRTMPELLFKYRAASWFANINCPEVAFGMMTTEEIEDVVDLHESVNGAWSAPVPAPDHAEAGLSLKERLEHAKNQGQEAREEATHAEAPAEAQEPQGEAQGQETEAAPDPREPMRNEFINIRKPESLSTFVFKNKDRIVAEFPDDLKAELRAKWFRIVTDGAPFPLDPPKEGKPEETKGSGERPTIHCPRKGSRVFVDVCESSNCGGWADCGPYRDWKDAQPSAAAPAETVSCPEKDGEEVPVTQCDSCETRPHCPSVTATA